MTTRIALFDCPHCIEEFVFDYRRIAKLTYGWRVRVRSPGCGNIVEVVMLNYTPIHGCDRDKYKAGKIIEILPYSLKPELKPVKITSPGPETVVGGERPS